MAKKITGDRTVAGGAIGAGAGAGVAALAGGNAWVGEDLEDVAVQLNNPVGTVWNIVKETKSWR